jgi:hypothetical protein
VPSQADGPRLLKLAMARSASTAPAAKARRIVGRAQAGQRRRAVVAGGDREGDAGRLQHLDIGGKLGDALPRRAGEAPRRVHHIGRVQGCQVAVGVEQPLEGQMNVAVARDPGVVVQLGRDPAGVGRDADGASAGRPAHHDPHGLGAVAGGVVGGGVFAVRVVPAVVATAPLRGQVRVIGVDSGVHVGDDDAAAGEALRPQLRRAHHVQIPFRRRGAAAGGRRRLEG